MITVSTLASRLIQEFGESQDSTEYATTLGYWINDAINEISLAANWKFYRLRTTLNTVAGQKTYTLPTNVREINQIRYTGSSTLPLTYVTVQQMAYLSVDFEQQGKPQSWYIQDYVDTSTFWQPEINLWPVPSGVYTMEIWYYTAPIEAQPTDNILVPAEFIIAIKDRVRTYQLEFEKDYAGAQLTYQRFRNDVAQLMARYDRPNAAFNRLQIRDITGNGSNSRFVRLDPSRFGYIY